MTQLELLHKDMVDQAINQSINQAIETKHQRVEGQVNHQQTSERQPKYWIIVASKDHVQKGVAGGFAQACHGKASPLKKIKNCNGIIYYSSKVYIDQKEKCQKFTAIGQAKNDEVYPFQMTADFCPARIDMDFLDAKEVSILPHINDLSFIQNKAKWGYPFRWGIIEIPKADYQLIADLMLRD